MSTPILFILYSTDCCHLCERAKDFLMQVAHDLPIQIDEQDIAFDKQLIERYGERIPVLKNHVNQAELAWAFTPEQLRAWLIAQIDQCQA